MLRVCLLALVLAPMLSHAQAADSLTVLATEHAANAALIRGEAAALDTLWAADLVFRHIDGGADGRADWQRRVGAGPVFEVRASDSLPVELHGDVAVLTGRVHARTVEPDEYTVRFVRVYAKRGGRWVLVHHRSLSFAEGPPEPLRGEG